VQCWSDTTAGVWLPAGWGRGSGALFLDAAAGLGAHSAPVRTLLVPTDTWRLVARIAVLACSCIRKVSSPCLASYPGRLVSVAKGGVWGLASHHLWPERFRGAVRALLLSAHCSRSPAGGSSSSGGQQPWSSPAPAPFTPLAAGRASQVQHASKRVALDSGSSGCPGLGALPSDLLLRVIQLSALPMSAWMPL